MIPLMIFLGSASKQLRDLTTALEGDVPPDPQVVQDLLAGAHRHLELAMVILAALQREAQA